MLTHSPLFAHVFEEAARAGAFDAQPPAGDVLALRAVLDVSLDATFSAIPPTEGMTVSRAEATAPDGHPVPLRVYRSDDVRPGPAVVYLHGGGMVAGSAEIYDPLVQLYAGWSGLTFVSVDYRLAPEHVGETAAEDALAAVRWLLEQAGDLGVDPARIAVMGDSGGGGVAAATAILARDRGVPLAAQILVYPMLDDRNTTPDETLSHLPTMWSYERNETAWRAHLDGLAPSDISPVAAPARLTDFSGLPPAYIEVGEVDIFRDESVRYAQGLWRAGVSTELHVHPGAPHGHDLFVVLGPEGAQWREDKLRYLSRL